MTGCAKGLLLAERKEAGQRVLFRVRDAQYFSRVGFVRLVVIDDRPISRLCAGGWHSWSIQVRLRVGVYVVLGGDRSSQRGWRMLFQCGGGSI